MVLQLWYVVFALWVLVGVIYGAPATNDTLELSIVHINDFHARFEQINVAGGDCKQPPCIGGFSRIFATVQGLLKEKPDSLLLNAGDNFQGTLYYNLFKHNITSEFMNKLPFDAITLGNHEFDDGIDGVVPFIKSLKAPVVVSNINDTLEPRIQGLYEKSVVVERNGKKIGIIGVVIQSCNEISNTEQLQFLDESESVNAEAERLVREEGVFTNIVLSHSGYGIEKLIAGKATNKISLIVGGHSHSFLYTGDNPPGPDKPAGDYPTVITSVDGRQILVVQASAYTKYLGNIVVTYDSDGLITDWLGSPIFMDTNIKQDEGINRDLQPYMDAVDAKGDEVLGSTLVRLERDDCRMGECLLGDFVADAMVFAYTKKAKPGAWTDAAICLYNTGGLRTTIETGVITYNDMITAQPFSNTVDVGDIMGKDLLEIFQFSATPYFYGREFININILQTSGVRLIMDITKPIGSRIVSLKVRCADCEIPVYEEVVPEKSYRLIVPSFLLRGGDGFISITKSLKNVTIGQNDMDVFTEYLKHKNPVFQEVEGRIVILGAEKIRTRDLFT